MPSYCFSSSSWASTTSTGSLFPSMSTYLLKPIPDEDFMVFHVIHCKLFSRLIFDLDREPNESMLVLAFWMWLDIDGYCMSRLVKKLLWKLSLSDLSLVANETLICLTCIQTKHEYFMFSMSDEEIHHLQMLMENKRLSLLFLHQDRERILSNVMVLLNEVCWRAFKDILKGAFGDSFGFNNPNEGGNSITRSTSTRINASEAPVIGIPPYPIVVPRLGFSKGPHFSPHEGSVGHGNEMGKTHFTPCEGSAGHGNRIGMSQFAPIEGSVGHGNGISMMHFAHEGGVENRNGNGMTNFVPNEGDVGPKNGLGMSQFDSIEGRIGLKKGKGMLQFPNEGIIGMCMPKHAPNEGGVGYENGMCTPNDGTIRHGMGMPQLAPIGYGDGMGMPHFVLNEGVGHGGGLGMPHFFLNEDFGHEMNVMDMPHFVPNNGGVHEMGAMRVPGHVVVPRHMVRFGPHMDFDAHFEPQDQGNQIREFTARELELMMSHVHISEPSEEQVPADDRTIFLTFSKGYPISESEVRIFFTRRFGEFIEDVFMQNVPRTQQPLHARVVARRLFDFKHIIRRPDDKLKFAINGKHVWARKYVKNSIPRSPGRGGPVR